MTATIVLGCSYACGEWQNGKIVHRGLAQYLQQQGQLVINLSAPGHALEWMLIPLKNFLELNQHLQVKDLVMIQTDISRNFLVPEYRQKIVEFARQHQWSVQSIIDKFYKDFYQDLNTILGRHGVRGYVFGGLTDVTVDLTDCQQLEVIEPSLCKMLSPDQSDQVRVTEVQAWKTMDQIFIDKKADMIDMMEISQQRNEFFKQSSYFPDNYHPDRLVHEMLYNKLQTHKEMNV